MLKRWRHRANQLDAHFKIPHRGRLNGQPDRTCGALQWETEMPWIDQALPKANLTFGFVKQQNIRLPYPVFEQDKKYTYQNNSPNENSGGDFHNSQLLKYKLMFKCN
jgi:hypothetical protein